MPNVTVLGASGATVTIPFTSAANAAAAQSALYSISQLVASTILTQYQYPGTGSVPAAPTAFGGVVISGSTPVNVGAIPQDYLSVVSNSTAVVPTSVSIAGVGSVTVTLPGTSVIGAFNPMTVASGTSGIMFLNVSRNADIFLGGGNNFIYERDAAAKAVINVDAGATYVEAKMGATTINAYDGAGMVIQAGGTGSTLINALGTTSFWVDGGGGGQVVTIQGASSGGGGGGGGGSGSGMGGHGGGTYVGVNHAATFINAGSGNLTIFGSYGGSSTDGSGAGGDSTGLVTLFGGTGSDTVYGGTGRFVGGSGGNNLMHTSTVTGATTLVGGGDGDRLYNHAAGNLLISGAGSETLFGTQDSTGGARFQLTGLNATVFGDAHGGNSFYVGAGQSLIEGSWASVHSVANYYSVIQGGGTDIITDFITGLDQFSLHYSTGTPTISSLTFYAASSSTVFGSHSGTAVVLSDSTKLFFYDANVKASDFT